MSYFTDFSKIDKTKYFFDEKAANSAVKYIETHCYHVKGVLAGTRFILEDWQKERIIKPLFGWKHKEPTLVKDANGNVIDTVYRRKYRKAYIEIPKKNGKSTLLSAIAQIFMDIDPEKGSEIIGVAWGRKQASIIFDMVEKSIRKSPRMADKVDYYKSTKVLLSKDGEKRYSIWSKEAGGEDGQFPQLVLIDELHEHKNGDVVSVAEKSMMGRINPLSMTITTAGSNLEGIGYQRRQTCEKIAEGSLIDESQLVCIFCADKEDDIYDEKTWYKANPQLGRSISLNDFLEEVKSSKISAANENSFKRYFLNIWNNTKDQFISDQVWNDSQWDFDTEKLKGLPCYGGLDLSSTTDITAFSLVFPIDDYIISLNWFWLPEDKGTQSVDEHNNRSYPTWVRDGFIEETPGNVVDYDYVISKIRELGIEYDIQAIAYDPYNATRTALDLQDEGFNMISFRQGFISMNFPTKELEKLVLSKKFNHLGNPVLRWMNRNTVVLTDPAGNIKITKEKQKLKVDGMITNVMALGLALDPNSVAPKSYLEETGGDLWTL